MQTLNKTQQKAVGHTSGPLLILAGAGSGKTKVLTHRIAHIIAEKNIPPSHILAVTFTNKAAEEMKKRVAQLLRSSRFMPRAALPWISTFHSLGAAILRQEASRAGRTKQFSILDEEDALTLIKDAQKELGCDPKQFQPARIRSIISKKKGELISYKDFTEETKTHYYPRIIAKIWERYEEKLKEQNALDFDDLLILTVNLFNSNPDILKRYQNKWRYIHIDEYQDTNHAQYVFTNLLARAHNNICVVGDIDQCIYSWRGADFRNILSFERDWPQARVITLEENYRSTQTILEAANAVIAKNKARKEKNLFTQKKGGERISIFSANNEAEEAAYVIGTTRYLLTQGVPKKDIAILIRTNFQSRILEEALISAGIPYQITGVKFFARKEIKDVLAYIRAALNRSDSISKKRVMNVPSRGIGKTLMLKILAEKPLSGPEKKKQGAFEKTLDDIAEIVRAYPASRALQKAMAHSGYWDIWDPGSEEGEMRLSNLKELITLTLRYDNKKPPEGILSLLEDAALMSAEENVKNEKDAIHIMTVHAAKGLEFDYLFVAGMEEGLFPHASPAGDETDERQEEERRLFYVALTRARKKLFLSYAIFRTIFGEKRVNMPSRFLADIPKHLLETQDDFKSTIDYGF
ncbi:MAG: UvrD-helicase domain-containing protein [Candidatus Niyogibacteria bacterium]|nr:UvrD-helicase domain-containing protein [Candidatus Niyogibacteria bacterium]